MKELLQQALDALLNSTPTSISNADDDYCESGWKEHGDAITALREALAAPMPEPVALMALDDINELMHCNGMSVFVENPRIYPPYCEGEPLVGFVPLYFAPPAAPAPVVPSFDRTTALILLQAASKSGDPGAIGLAAQLAGAAPCKDCGYVNFKCRCQSAAPVVPLTDEHIIELRVRAKSDYKPWSESIAFARAIERAHGIGGGGK